MYLRVRSSITHGFMRRIICAMAEVATSYSRSKTLMGMGRSITEYRRY